MSLQSEKKESEVISRANCKNHPNETSRFYVLDQPQVRYCKICALNMALCGRKIEKDLTPQEYERKLLIDSIVEQLRVNISEVEANQAYYEQLASFIELSSYSITKKLEIVQTFMKKLAKIKLKLQVEYDNSLNSKLKEFTQKRNDLSNDRHNIKTELQNIESNFDNLIQNKNQSQFSELKINWGEVIAKTSKDLLTQEYFVLQKNKIGYSAHILQQEFTQLSKLKVLELIPQQSQLAQSKDEESRQELADISINQLNSMILVEELKLNLTANAQMKNRKNIRKINTERQTKQTYKKGKKTSVNQRDAPIRKTHY